MYYFLESFSSNGSLGYDGNRGLGLDNKSRGGTQSIRQKPYNMDSDNLNNGQRQNSMISEGLKMRPPSGLKNRNKQIYNVSENQNTRKRQNTVTSDFQDFPNLTQIKTNPSAKRTERLRQKPLPPSLNEDNSQQINDNIENSGMVNYNTMSFRKCCINGNCRMLKDGEECGIEDIFVSNLYQVQRYIMFKSLIIFYAVIVIVILL